jgi:hypothetical protein
METYTESKRSGIKEHYWGDNGAYQKSLEELRSLVPDKDKAETIHGELVRSIERLYYDYCNNGNMNCLEYDEIDCPQCDGSGWDDEEAEIDCHNCMGDCYVNDGILITNFFKQFVNFLLEFGDANVKHQTYKLQDWMLEHGLKGDFRDEYMNIYDHIVDAVVEQCITTENKLNPYFKKQ